MKIADVLGADFWQGGELLMRAVAAGYNPDVRIVRKVGQNLDLDSGTVPEDMWDLGGLYTGFPPGSQTPERFSIVSDSANDTAAGSGARTVSIVGLDANWDEIEETVTLNGLTPVLTVNTYRRFTGAQVLTSGGTVANSAFNAGNIVGRYQTTTANVFFRIPSGFNVSRDGNYTVPNGWNAILIGLRVEMDRSAAATAEGALFLQTDGRAPLTGTLFTVGATLNFHDDLIGGVPLAPKTDIIPRVRVVSANNVDLYCSYEILLYRP